ncbi:MAG: carboxypeptidase regulatory-like domain-containing protein, partial [Pyrinomonadaceae bacterium]
LVTNQTGTFLYAANGNSRNLTTYSANPTTGVLTNSGVQPLDTLGTTGRLTGIDYLARVPTTAASVTVGGRVTTAARAGGVARARVTLTYMTGETRTALTNSFGYYRFENVAAGQTYIFEVRHKRSQFAPQVITVTDEIDNLDFTAAQ